MNTNHLHLPSQQAPMALVLGPTGSLGFAALQALLTAGWQVRALYRPKHHASPVLRHPALQWIAGDALNAPDVHAAAQGCDAIIHAVHPANYTHWAAQSLPLLQNTLDAASDQTTIVLPGNLYALEPQTAPALADLPRAFRLDESAPAQASTSLGRLRIEMEQRLENAAQRGTCKALVVRAGDFFGPHAPSSWLAQAMVRPGKCVRTLRLPGTEGVGHQWNYLPDLAQTIVQLLARRKALPAWSVFHTAGHWDADGLEMARTIQRCVARAQGLTPRTAPFPWWLLRAVAPLHALSAHLLEMRWLWTTPLALDNRKLTTVLQGAEPHTPWETAVAATLSGMGCLPGGPSAVYGATHLSGAK